MPHRIQRKRTKGWRMPECAVYVGRPSKWGNPYKPGDLITLTGKDAGQPVNAAGLVEFYRNLAHIETAAGEDFRQKVRAELAGRGLACWCPLDQPCHADVLLEIANVLDQTGGEQ